MSNFEVKDCCLYVRGNKIECEDDLVRLAGLLTTGLVPEYLDEYDLADHELIELEGVLAREIFLNGNCLQGPWDKTSKD